MKLAGLILAGTLGAQELPPLPKYEFSGKPIVLPYVCTEEQLYAVGMSCPESEPCPMFAELASVDEVEGKLFLVGNLHSAAATYSSLLLMSEDSGKTWTEPFERVPQAVLEGIQFADANTGWIAGQLLTTLPRDPFFIITTDGGKTWKKRPIYEESKVAVIDSFYFESPRDGIVAVDRSRSGEPSARSELYETRTGGESWMLREVSAKALRLKKTRTPLTDLRLRADGASKSYRVEQLVNNRWALVASFAVKLADCKIGLKELIAPPEPEPTPEPAKPVGPKTPPSLKKKQ